MGLIIIQYFIYLAISLLSIWIGYLIGKKSGVKEKVEIIIATQQKIHEIIKANEVATFHKRIEDSDIERQLFKRDINSNATDFINYIKAIRMPMFFEDGNDGFYPIFWEMAYELSLHAIDLILVKIEKDKNVKTPEQIAKQQRLITYYKAMKADLERTK